MAKKFLTLNIGAANIELAEYEQGGKGSLTLVNYGTATLAAALDAGNAETILAPALLELVRERGFRPGPVTISVSGQIVFPKFVAIPEAGGAEKFEQRVRYEIEQGIPFPIDEMVCDRQILGDTDDGDKSVMIVAAKIDQIEAITSAVQSAGFTPEIVDVAPIALVNAIRFGHDGDERCIVALDIGAKTTSLVIVEGDKVYTRSIPVAGNAVTKEITTALGCSQEEAEICKREKGYVSLGGVTEDEDEIANRVSKACRAVMTRLNAEISRSINFYRSQQKGNAPTKLYLTGGTALLPQIDAFFAEELGIEVEFFNPFERIAVGPAVDAAVLESDGALISATAGLALHHANLAHFQINLLPPSIMQDRLERSRLPFLILGGVGLVAALVLLALAIGNDTAVIEAKRDAVQHEADELDRYDKKVVKSVKELEAEKDEAERLRALIASRSLAVQRMNAVRSALLPGMWIDKWENGRVTIRFWKDRVTIPAGKTASEMFVAKLKGRPVVDPDKVQISGMIAGSLGGAPEQFTVEVKFK